MTYLETQQNDVQAAKDEIRRLRTKMKTFERCLQSHRLGPHFNNHYIDLCENVLIVLNISIL